MDGLIVLAIFRASDRLNCIVGPSGLIIVWKVLDILKAAIAVSYLVKGIIGLGF